MTGFSEKNKLPIDTGYSAPNLSELPNHTGPPIPDQDKNAEIIADPIPDVTGFEDPCVTINPYFNKPTIFN